MSAGINYERWIVGENTNNQRVRTTTNSW